MYENEMLLHILATAISAAQSSGRDTKRAATDAAKAFKAGLNAFNEPLAGVGSTSTAGGELLHAAFCLSEGSAEACGCRTAKSLADHATYC